MKLNSHVFNSHLTEKIEVRKKIFGETKTNLQTNLSPSFTQDGLEILKNQIRTCMFSGRRMSEGKDMAPDAINRILLVRTAISAP